MARFKTATEGWQHVRKFTDVSKDAYIQHENGTRGFKARAEDYARAYDVTPAWLLWNDVPQAKKPASAGLALSAETSGGSPVMPPDHLTDAPSVEDADGRRGLVVPDEANAPRLRRGETVIVGAPVDDIEAFVSREVLAKIAEGPAVLRRLRRGSAEGLWTLEARDSTFTMPDRKVDWICPVLWIRISPPDPEDFDPA